MGLPTAEMNCDLAEYVDMICGKQGRPCCRRRRCWPGSVSLKQESSRCRLSLAQPRSFSAAFSRKRTPVPQAPAGFAERRPTSSGAVGRSACPGSTPCRVVRPSRPHALLLSLVATLDIPVYKSRIQPLHVLFSLYSEFKNSQVSDPSQAPLTQLAALQSCSPHLWLCRAVVFGKGWEATIKGSKEDFLSSLFPRCLSVTKEPLVCHKGGMPRCLAVLRKPRTLFPPTSG